MATKVTNKEKKTFYSITEFKKRYLPKSFEKQMSEVSEDARDLGIIWAKESMDKIKVQSRE